jgi:hypothetical protein
MIIEPNFCEPNIGSINGCHYNNFGCWPLDIFVEWNGRMFFSKPLCPFISQLHTLMNEWMSCTSRIFGEFVISLSWCK